jgi:malate dehydrogenase (oxaloacetate-decarboxylating)(NADP+)
MADDLREAALYYHRVPKPGKLAIEPTKPLVTQRDLSLAYSPGVAFACNAIADDPGQASNLTARGNLVGVVTNGTAVLGLGNIGPLASKPVMEGKAVLFKKFADIDVFDIELNESDPEKLVNIIAALEPTFGGINLEDIKAPECFIIERALRERMNIPVFHDDQHGTAITVAAAVVNGLELVGKQLSDISLVASGAGAAALACLDLLVRMGLPRGNIIVTDIAGVVHVGRNELMDPFKERYAVETEARTLGEVIGGADVFLGLSAPGVLKPDMVERMAEAPLVLALANPTPEIMPEEVKAVRPDAVVATGRTDYPNQVNNVLCFPYIFRGALDVGATTINEEMKIAAVEAIARLARQESSDVVAQAYGGEALVFGPEYLIPKPFDPRLILEIAPAVARAAVKSGVATRKIEDFDVYRQRLAQFADRSVPVMRPVFLHAKNDPKRVVYAEGEEVRVLRATQTVVDENLARPILIGRPEVIDKRIHDLGLRLKPGVDVEIVDPANDSRYEDYWRTYHRLMERRGVSPDRAREVMRTRTTSIAAMMVRKRDADAGICGTIGRYTDHLDKVMQVIGMRPGVGVIAAVNLLILPQGLFFMVDTFVNPEPDIEQIAEMVVLAAHEVRSFGLEPKVALLSSSNFGTRDIADAKKMREAAAQLKERHPELEVEGEMHADVAVSEAVRKRVFPSSRLSGTANLLVMPNLDAANISYNLLKSLGRGLSLGPMLVGTARPMHILTASETARGIINMTAVATVDAQEHEKARRKAG